jgi:hypothetical protein
MPQLESLRRYDLACDIFDLLQQRALEGIESVRDALKAVDGFRNEFRTDVDDPDDLLQFLAVWMKEDKFLELAKKIRVNIDSSEEAGNYWLQFHFRLFISHVSDHMAMVSALGKELRQYGIHGFLAHSDIHPTQQWRDQIRWALRTCDALLALMTPDFHSSDWTDQEIGFVLGLGRLESDP